MKFYKYLPFWFLLTVLAFFTNWLWPLFRQSELGNVDNNHRDGVEPRLPSWLSWFMTPDNSLWGEDAWKTSHPNQTYWDMVAWLNRNKIYGFQYSRIGARVKGRSRLYLGNRGINYHTSTTGRLKVSCCGYWQYKSVTPFIFGYFWVLNFGWILDNETQDPSMYVVSVRVRKGNKP